MKKIIEKKLSDVVNKLYSVENIIFEVDVPKNFEHGDFTSNIALKLSGVLKKNPKVLAEEIIQNLQDEIIQKTVTAGPGFINFFVSKTFFHDYLRNILTNEDAFKLKDGKNKKFQVEFVSANPTGPLHIGHGRGAAYGDSLVRILSAVGYDVQREYYVNDAGNQMNNLALSIYSRCMELLGKTVDFPADGYKGEYIYDISKKIIDTKKEAFLEMSYEDAVDLCFKIGVKEITDCIDNDLNNFGVSFDNWFSEKSLYTSGDVEQTIVELKTLGKAYESEGALWFKSMDYGDDKDRVLVRSNGEHTYFASDIAYHRNKFKRGFEYVVNVWGADHHGYVKRLKSAVNAIGVNEENLDIRLVQMVSLIQGGEKISMSTRAGTFVELKWLIDEVGKDAARYFYIMRDINSQLEFDIDLAKSRSSENPVYYIQYAHARVCSILRNAHEKQIKYHVGQNFELLIGTSEIDVIKKIYDFTSVLSTAAHFREPHRIPYYLQELAAIFHNYYKNNQILIEDNTEKTGARISLCMGVAKVIKFGLSLIGVDAPEKM